MKYFSSLYSVITVILLCSILVPSLGLSAEKPKPPAPNVKSTGAAVSASTPTSVKAAFPKLTAPNTAVNLVNPNVDLKAKIMSPAGDPLANRTIIFWVDGKIVGDKLSGGDGTATFTYNAGSLSVGTHSWTAIFEGDGQYLKTQDKADLIVNKAASKITLNEAKAEWVLDKMWKSPKWILHFGATLEGGDKKPVPGAVLHILVDGKPAVDNSGKPINASCDSSGQCKIGASCGTSDPSAYCYNSIELTAAAHNVSFEFSGDAKYLGSSVNRQIPAPTNTPTKVVLTTDFVYSGTLTEGYIIKVQVIAYINGQPVKGVDINLSVVHQNAVAQKSGKSGSDGMVEFHYKIPANIESETFKAYVDNAQFKGESVHQVDFVKCYKIQSIRSL